MDERRLFRMFLARHVRGLHDHCRTGRTWNDICRDLGVERIGSPKLTLRGEPPEGFVEIADPADVGFGGRIRMTVETAMKVLTIGIP